MSPSQKYLVNYPPAAGRHAGFRCAPTTRLQLPARRQFLLRIQAKTVWQPWQTTKKREKYSFAFISITTVLPFLTHFLQILPVSSRLMGDSSLLLSPLALRGLFLVWSSVSRRGMTTDRNVFVPSRELPLGVSPSFMGLWGLVLFDLRKSTEVRRFTGLDGSARVDVATTLTSLSSICRWECPLSGWEMPSLWCWRLSGQGSIGFSVGGSEWLPVLMRGSRETDGSSLGGTDLSPAMKQGDIVI